MKQVSKKKPKKDISIINKYILQSRVGRYILYLFGTWGTLFELMNTPNYQVIRIINLIFILIMGVMVLGFKVTKRVEGYMVASIGLVNIMIGYMYIYSFESGMYKILRILLFILIYEQFDVMVYFGSGAFLIMALDVFIWPVPYIDSTRQGSYYRLGFVLFSILIALIYSKSNMGTKKQLEKSRDLLEKESKSKDEFLANMSHEIRTPMNAVCGMAELLLREKDISEAAKDHAYNIQSAGKNLLAIINDILDFSKIEFGKMEIVQEPYNIAFVINDVINMCMTRKYDKCVDIIMDMDSTIPCELIGDELRLKQIIINLMSNSIKYTPVGSITLSVRQRTLKEKQGIMLTISVKDTGMGIKETDLEKIFASFEQVDSKKNRRKEGTGLGLAICKKIVEQMGGFIMVSSTYGEGSEFRFSLPQKVGNQEASILVEHPEKVNAATLIDLNRFYDGVTKEQYRHFVKNMTDGLKIQNKLCISYEGLKEYIEKSEVKITHVILTIEEYLGDKVYFDRLASECMIIVAQNRQDMKEVGTGIHSICKPLFVLSIANVLNGQSDKSRLEEISSRSSFFSASKARILVVDDNIVNLKEIKGLLGPYKVKLTLAASGREAIEYAEHQVFDMILMDHMMPGMDGIEAAKIIRNKGAHWCREVPMIALTANAVSGAREQFLEEGFQDFVAKPIEVPMLERVLKKWLNPVLVDVVEVAATDTECRATEKINRWNRGTTQIDVKLGLHYLAGNQAQYLDLLRTYLRQGRKKAAEIETYYETNNWENYQIQVHALKSTSLNIGAKEFSAEAKKLEYAAKDNNIDFIKKNNQQVLELFAKVLLEVEGLLDQAGGNERPQLGPIKERPEFTKKELKNALIDVKECLGKYEQEEARTILSKMCLYRYSDEAMEDLLKEIIWAVDDYDTEEAVEDLTQWIEKLK